MEIRMDIPQKPWNYHMIENSIPVYRYFWIYKGIISPKNKSS